MNYKFTVKAPRRALDFDGMERRIVVLPTFEGLMYIINSRGSNEEIREGIQKLKAKLIDEIIAAEVEVEDDIPKT